TRQFELVQRAAPRTVINAILPALHRTVPAGTHEIRDQAMICIIRVQPQALLIPGWHGQQDDQGCGIKPFPAEPRSPCSAPSAGSGDIISGASGWSASTENVEWAAPFEARGLASSLGLTGSDATVFSVLCRV